MREARESSWCIKKSNWREKNEGKRMGGCTSVKADHITHRVFLESELVSEVKENVFYFLRGDGYLAF